MPNPCSGGAITCPVCPVAIDWCDGFGLTFGVQNGATQEFTFPGVFDAIQADGDPWPRGAGAAACTVTIPGWEIIEWTSPGAPANPSDEGVPALAVDDATNMITHWWDPGTTAWIPLVASVALQTFELGQEGPVTADPGALADQHFWDSSLPVTIVAARILFPIAADTVIDVDLAIGGAVVQTENVPALTRVHVVPGPFVGSVVPALSEIAEQITSVNGATVGEDMILLVEFTR